MSNFIYSFFFVYWRIIIFLIFSNEVTSKTHFFLILFVWAFLIFIWFQYWIVHLGRWHSIFVFHVLKINHMLKLRHWANPFKHKLGQKKGIMLCKFSDQLFSFSLSKWSSNAFIKSIFCCIFDDFLVHKSWVCKNEWSVQLFQRSVSHFLIHYFEYFKHFIQYFLLLWVKTSLTLNKQLWLVFHSKHILTNIINFFKVNNPFFHIILQEILVQWLITIVHSWLIHLLNLIYERTSFSKWIIVFLDSSTSFSPIHKRHFQI